MHPKAHVTADIFRTGTAGPDGGIAPVVYLRIVASASNERVSCAKIWALTPPPLRHSAERRRGRSSTSPRTNGAGELPLFRVPHLSGSEAIENGFG